MQMFSIKFLPPTLIFRPHLFEQWFFGIQKVVLPNSFQEIMLQKLFFLIMFEFMQDAVDMADQS